LSEKYKKTTPATNTPALPPLNSKIALPQPKYPKANLQMKISPRRILILTTSIAALATNPVVQAATLFYDGGNVNIAANGNSLSGGTAGTWSTTVQNWDVGPVPHVGWSDSFLDTAVFAGTAAAVTVGGIVQVGTMSVTSSNYSFNTGTINFGTAGIFEANNTTSTIMNASLAGVLKIQSTGSAATVISGPSLMINGTNLGLTSTEVSLNTINNNITINNAAAFGDVGATVKLTKGVVNLGNTAAPNNNVPISYNAWNTEMAGGTFRARFSASTWNGATTLTADSGMTARGAAGVSLTFAPTATIALGSSTLTLDVDTASAGITLNGIISGNGNIKTDTLGLSGGGNGNGVTTLGAANTFSGRATTVAGRGTLALNHVDALQNATLDTGSTAGTQSVTFLVPGSNTYNIGALAGSDALAIGGNTITVGSKAEDTIFNAEISGIDGGLNKIGSHTLTLAAATSFTGATNITGGTLALTASGSLSGSSGITINGATAKLIASGAAAVLPSVTLTQGTLTGSGTVNIVDVGAGTGATISNNDGAPGGTLSVGSLTLAGGASLNLFSSGTTAPLVVGTLTNDAPQNAVTIIVSNPGGWANGSTYDIVGYSTLGGTGGNNFARTVNNLAARQSATWGDSGTALTLAIAGDNPFWSGAANGNWNTIDTNWKLVTANTNTNFIATDDVLFNDGATGTTVVNIDGANVAPNTTVFNNSTLNYTLSSLGGFGISAGSVTKNGSGTATINTANTHTGGTTINAGKFNIGHASALGSAASTLTLNGGTIDNTSGASLTTNNHPIRINGDFTFAGTSSLNLGNGLSSLGSAAGTSRAITVSANTLSIGGAIANGTTADSIVKNGPGTLALTGTNSFTGSATLNAGILRAEANPGALGAGSLILSGGELQLAGDPQVAFGRNTTVTADSRITSDTLTASPGVAHTLGALSIGTNRLTIGKGVNATGNTSGVSFGATTFSGTPSFVVEANSTLTLGTVNDGGNNATITGAGQFRALNAWGAGSGGITLDAAFTGTATLGGANTFTGEVTIDSGTLVAQSNAALGSNVGGTKVNAGGTLDLGGTLGTNTLNLGTEVITVRGAGVGGNGAIVNNSVNDQINATGRIVLADNASFGGIRRWDLRSNAPTLDMGGFNITKVGINQVSLVGTIVSNPGNITVSSGFFGVETTSDLGGSSANKITVNPGATFGMYNNTIPVAWSVDVDNGTINQGNGNASVSGPITLSGANTVSVPGTTLTLTGTVSGTGGFNKTGVGALIVNSSNTYEGLTTITAGQLRVSTPDGLGGTTNGVNVVSGGGLQINNGITTPANETISLAGGGSDFFGALQAGPGGGTWTGGVKLEDAFVRIGATSGSTLIVTGTIADGAGTGFNVSGQLGTGIVVINPTTTNTYTGTTGVLRGIARLGKSDALPTGTVLDVDSLNSVPDAAQFDLAGFNQTVAALQDTATINASGVILNSVPSTTSVLTVNGSQTTEFNGAIQNGDGIVALKKDGPGSLQLSGTNTFTGPTNLDGGSLIVTGSISGSAVTITDGGILSGTGITGAVAANSGATISPGLSPGVLTVGALTMSAGSILSIEINGLAPGTEYDQLNVNGTVDITGATLTIGGAYLTAPAITNDLFTILLNDGNSDAVVGTFDGLAEGARALALNGQDYVISYIGGDGNDIVLTAIPEPGSAALMVGGLGILMGIRRRRRE
jgi:autotransporter-associated beta strand protein